MAATSPTTTICPPVPNIVINVHALHPVASSLLNRDDTGAQKTITVGGTLRTRASSQCWKRAARLQMRKGAVSEGSLSLRTNHLPGLVAQALVDSGAVTDINVARTKSAAVFLAMGFGLKTDEITSNSTFVHSDTPQYIAAAMRDDLDEIVHVPAQKAQKATETAEAKKAQPASGRAPQHVIDACTVAFDIRGAVDLALFGSFLTVGKIKSRHDGALSYNHPYSVDPARIVSDFYTAVDDWVIDNHAEGIDDGDAMSNNVGVSDLSAQVFYRSMCIDVNQLRRQLDGDDELITAAIVAAIDTFINSVPSAKQTSTNAGTRPSLVVATVGGSRLTVDNAFTRVITGDNVVSDATARLFAQLVYATRFGTPQHHVVLAGDADADAQIPAPEGFPAPMNVVTTLSQLVDAVQAEIGALEQGASL